MTVLAKTLRKFEKTSLEIKADFVLPVFILPLLQISLDSPFRCCNTVIFIPL